MVKLCTTADPIMTKSYYALWSFIVGCRCCNHVFALRPRLVAEHEAAGQITEIPH